MITAVDTNVLLDVVLPDAQHGPRSAAWLRAAYDAGAIIICDVVYAELVPTFNSRAESRAELDDALRELDVTLSPTNASIAYEAGLRWKQYRRAGGPRQRIISDFLVGAHAIAAADSFLTRDRGFYRTYFPELARRAGP